MDGDADDEDYVAHVAQLVAFCLPLLSRFCMVSPPRARTGEII